MHIVQHEGEYYIAHEDMGDTLFLVAKLEISKDAPSITLYKRGSEYYPKRVDLQKGLRIELGPGGNDDNFLISFQREQNGEGNDVSETIQFSIPIDWKIAKSMIARYYKSNLNIGSQISGSTSTLC